MAVIFQEQIKFNKKPNYSVYISEYEQNHMLTVSENPSEVKMVVIFMSTFIS